MKDKVGKFLVIEGTDGSGKSVQLDILSRKLEDEGYQIYTSDFPQYDKPSAYFVTQYLNGVYGGLDETGPYKSSLFFALDRFDASRDMRMALETNKIIISNRYVGSNMGHQGSKILSRKKRQSYFKWLYELEFDILGIPKPDLNIILYVPPQIAQRLVDEKGDRKYIGGSKRDLHESDLKHLEKSALVYLEIAKLFPSQFTVINCMDDNRLMTREEIGDKVWELAQEVIQ